MRRTTLAVLVVALSFGALALDLRFLHRFATKTSWHAYIPAIYCGLSSLALLVSLPRWERARRVAAWVCASGVLVGGIGLLHHTQGRPMKLLEVMDTSLPRAAKPAGSTRATSSVAPLSLAGLGVLGFILVWPGRARKAAGASNTPPLKVEEPTKFRWPDAA